MAESLRIHTLAQGGSGLGRLSSGKACFVNEAFPGDELEVAAIIDRKRHAEATEWTLSNPSPDRITPTCPIAARCGGCNWMALAPLAQHQAKQQLLLDALTKIGQLESVPVTPFRVAGPPLGYRSRIRLQVDEQGRLGFHQRGTNVIVPVSICAVVTPAVQRALDDLATLAAAHPVGLRTYSQVEVRSLDSGSASLLLWRRRGRTPDTTFSKELSKRFQWREAELTSGHIPTDRLMLTRSVYCDVPVGGFSQVNLDVNRAIIAHLLEQVARLELKSFADVYCGSGNFALALLAAGLEGAAVESNRSAIEVARKTASAQKLPVGTFQAGSAEVTTRHWQRTQREFDLVVCNPPRAGMKRCVDAVADIASRYVFICACDPVSLARDVRLLVDRGFILQTVTAWDMFPQTHHFETTAWLARTGERPLLEI